MRDDSIRVTATTVRIPVMGGHSEAVNVEFEKEFDLAEVKATLQSAPGIIVIDDPANQQYPMPMDAYEKDEVFVGRLRRDESQPKTLNMWVVSDNLRKGAATNAVQIAEYLLAKNLLGRFYSRLWLINPIKGCSVSKASNVFFSRSFEVRSASLIFTMAI